MSYLAQLTRDQYAQRWEYQCLWTKPLHPIVSHRLLKVLLNLLDHLRASLTALYQRLISPQYWFAYILFSRGHYHSPRKIWPLLAAVSESLMCTFDFLYELLGTNLVQVLGFWCQERPKFTAELWENQCIEQWSVQVVKPKTCTLEAWLPASF